MTNEMQLAQAAGLAGHELAPAAQSQTAKPTGVKKLHRLLRGRYPLVITLGLIFGVAGAVAGYASQKPLYKSKGWIEIDPTIHVVGSVGDETMPAFPMFLQSQVALITSNELIQSALIDPVWKAAGGTGDDDTAVAHFAQNLDVDIVPGTTLILVAYSDPDRIVAAAGANAICNAYSLFYSQPGNDPLRVVSRQAELDKQKKTYGDEVQNDQSYLTELENQYHTDDLTTFQAEEMASLGDLDRELKDAQKDLALQTSMFGSNASSGNGATANQPPITEDQLAALGDQHLLQLRAERDQIKQTLARLMVNYGDTNPTVQYRKGDLAVLNAEISAYVQSYSQGSRPVADASGHFAANASPSLAGAQKRVQVLQDQFQKQQSVCEEISDYAQKIADTKAKLAKAQQSLDNVNDEYQRLQSQSALNANTQMQIVSKPIPESEPSTDLRKKMAAVGFLAGGLFPAFVVLLIGLLDGRFRYSDETNTDLGGVPLLGILPNLPDLLTDPSQAATAAHCVHQIRTILQITGQSVDRRVFAVTSASPGDGKTSLTLALGLSFAASGSRTLLVDGDLVGGGLTARLNVAAEHGVLEAMAARDITPFIRTTDVSDLSFLPVGQALGGYTGTISPAAVRRLVNEARNHFDVILIDTGPILGSIEASPVAVACDAVVLCVSRGQQRQLVDRALAHLQAIGAKLAGVVFNRAQAHDFERSTNRLGLGSTPAANGNGHSRGEAIGPVARAVASSVRSAGTHDRT